MVTIKGIMAEGITAKTVQAYLVGLNILFVIVGMGLLMAGCWLAIDQNVLIYVRFLGAVQKDELLRLVAYVAIVMGGAIFLLAFSGCCGALRESTCLLTSYCVILVTLVVAECSAAILIYLFKSRVEVLLIRSLQDQVMNKYLDNNTMGMAWDTTQNELQCCGVLSFSDWLDSKWFDIQQPLTPNQNNSQFVPWSCCRHDIIDIMVDNSTSLLTKAHNTCQEEARTEIYRAEWLNKRGCFDSIMLWLKEQSAYFIAAAVLVVVLQVLGTTAAIVHVSKIKDKNLVVPINILPNSVSLC